MEVDPGELSEDTAYGTIEKWDSLMHMRMVMEIEEEYYNIALDRMKEEQKYIRLL